MDLFIKESLSFMITDGIKTNSIIFFDKIDGESEKFRITDKHKMYELHVKLTEKAYKGL